MSASAPSDLQLFSWMSFLQASRRTLVPSSLSTGYTFCFCAVAQTNIPEVRHQPTHTCTRAHRRTRTSLCTRAHTSVDAHAHAHGTRTRTRARIARALAQAHMRTHACVRACALSPSCCRVSSSSCSWVPSRRCLVPCPFGPQAEWRVSIQPIFPMHPLLMSQSHHHHHPQ